jgi:hypothetical protein
MARRFVMNTTHTFQRFTRRLSIRRLIGVLGCIGLATLSVPFTATADSPEPVSFEGASYFGYPTAGDFEATGLPECDSGTFEDQVNRPTPSEAVEPGYVRHIVREFTCDGSGHTFVVKAELRYNFPLGTPADYDGDLLKRYPTLNWLKVAGDGPFEELHMNGQGYVAYPIFGDSPSPIGEYDVFYGRAH